MSTLNGSAINPNEIGVLGESIQYEGVRGISSAPQHGGVVGINNNDNSNPANPAGPGVYGTSKGTGVWGNSETWIGVYGYSSSNTQGVGVYGEAIGPGVIGKSTTWHGIYGETQSITGGAGVWGEHKENGAGVVGKSAKGTGIWGSSDSGEAIHAETKSPTLAAIAAIHQNNNGTGAAIYAEKQGTIGHAGFFRGNVHVTGNLTTDGDILLANADCAEDFDIITSEQIDPGTVMILGENGVLQSCNSSYDKKVAGVISGAGSFKPGIILDKRGNQDNRMPLALLGKVFCKIDADIYPVEVGDLLTSSDCPGHAMKATDPVKSFGAIIGKALKPLAKGKGLIPILVTLQ